MAKVNVKYRAIKRGQEVYRRRIPKDVQHRFDGASEFTRALSGRDEAERGLQYEAAAKEFEFIASGEAARLLSKGVVPRANNPNAPPLSPEAVKINQGIADLQRKLAEQRTLDAANAEAEIGTANAAPVVDDDPDPPTVAEAVACFLSDPLRASTEGTKEAHTPRLDTLAALLGPKTLIAAVTKDTFRKAVTGLHELPREYRRAYADLTPSEAIERAKADKQPPLSSKTRAHYIATWRSFFAWCEEEDLITTSPAKAMKAPKVETTNVRQEAWKTPAMNTLFQAPIFQDPVQRVARPGAFWLPLISLHQGMRCGEIALLDRSEIIDVGGVWCFDIRTRPGRTLKTKPSVRVVPIHKTLLDLGLLEHWRSLPDWASPSPEWPQGPLFPDLMVNKHGKAYSDPTDEYGKTFKALTAQQGLRTAADGREGHVFHALRHRFTTACRAGRMPDSVRLYLGGWAQKEGVASSYGEQDIPALRDELERVKFPGVTLPAPSA